MSKAKRFSWLYLATAAAVATGGVGTYLVLKPSVAEQVLAALPPPPPLGPDQGPLQAALDQAWRAASQGGDATTLAAYARLLHANEFSAEAETCWRLLLHIDDDDARWPYYLAQLRRDAGDRDESTALLRETTLREPTYAPAWLQLGEAAFKSGQFDAARAAYQQRLSLLEADPYAQLGLARLAERSGDESAAITALQRITTEHPTFSSAHNLLARMLSARGDLAAARQHRWAGQQAGRFAEAEDPWLDELNAACLKSSRLLFLGMRAFQTGRGDQGRSRYEKAVELAPRNAEAHELLGDLYQKLGDDEPALVMFERAYALGQPRPAISVFVNLGDALRKRGQFDRVDQLCREGLALYPAAPELHIALGILRQSEGHTEAALAAFRRALEFSPNHADANFNLAVLLLESGETATALQHFERSLTLQPSLAPSLTFLAQYWLAANQLDRAEPYVMRLVDAYYGVPAVKELAAIWYLRSGRAALQQRRPADAIKTWRTGLEISPDHADLALELGTILLTQGRFPEAAAPLETLLALRPEDAQAHLFLAQVRLTQRRIADARALLERGIALADAAGNAQTAANLRALLAEIARSR